MKDYADFLYKTFWTAVAAAGSALAAPALFDVEAWQAAGIAALTVSINGVTVFARQRAESSN